MADFTVRRRGTDTSGRGIYASDYMWDWWLNVCDYLGFTPTVTQSAWMTMNGGGAAASAGYHDGGGCFDLRVYDRTQSEIARMIRTLREHGAAAWLRDRHRGGFTDPHIHFVLGTDFDLASGAAYQWRDYIAGGDGMGGRDYHPRPSPLVTKPPPLEEDMTPELKAEFDKIHTRLDNERERDIAERERDRRDLLRVLAKLDKLHPDEGGQA